MLIKKGKKWISFQKATSKKKRSLLQKLSKRGASIPIAQLESVLSHISREIAFIFVQISNQF